MPHSISHRQVVDQVDHVIREKVLAELESPVVAAESTTEIVPLLHWGTLRCDRSDDWPVTGDEVQGNRGEKPTLSSVETVLSNN